MLKIFIFSPAYHIVLFTVIKNHYDLLKVYTDMMYEGWCSIWSIITIIQGAHLTTRHATHVRAQKCERGDTEGVSL